MKLLWLRYRKHRYNYRNILSTIHKLLYGDNRPIVDRRPLFYDLDMGNTLQHATVEEIMDNCRIPFGDALAKIYTIANSNNRNWYMSTTDLNRILTICDKLAMHNTIDKILMLNTPSKPCAPLIINHSLSNDALIELYAKTSTYNLLYGCLHCNACDIVRRDNVFHNTTLNRLRITSINVHDNIINDDDIKYYTSIVTLKIYDKYKRCKITTCAPFAKSLKVLHAYSELCDKGLKLCTSITELNANNTYGITTCGPFANSLKILHASGLCGIDDRGLVLCHSITTLDASCNVKITTCEPFAKTLTILNAVGNCGIADIGVALCHNIEKLDVSCNSKITTCTPFAKSLTSLDAAHSCGINDNSIATCVFLKYLKANYNPMITTCIPFARSLRHLFAAGDQCGITTKGVLPCKSLIVLCNDNNDKIDRSKITMAKRDGRYANKYR